MHGTSIELICDGDYHHREKLRNWFSIEDLEFIHEKEKSAQQTGGQEKNMTP